MSMYRRKPPDLDARHPHPEIVLVGQPNCGKSTLFNSVAGYRSVAANFPGATVEYTRSHVAINGRTCNLVDLPGIYSLTALDPAAEETKKYLLEKKVDVLINVVDAVVLSRSLELTLQLLELGLPIVLCLNMMDEAKRKGVIINFEELSALLGIPVAPAIAARGKGVERVFVAAFGLLQQPRPAVPLRLSRHVEQKVELLMRHLAAQPTPPKNLRLAALKLLEDDPYFLQQFSTSEETKRAAAAAQAELEAEHGDAPAAVIAAERHHAAMRLFEQVAVVEPHRHTWSSRIDELAMHPLFGNLIMLFILFVFFIAVFRLGALVEGPLLGLLNLGIERLTAMLPLEGAAAEMVLAALQGIAAGIAIVLPYLAPFLTAMAFIEDLGYLPRIAFLLDGVMHRIGLHGVAVVPAMLGYGCSVPAVMATRLLNTPRDRFIASVVSVLVPCSARMVVIMGLVGYYLGGAAAFAVYLLNAAAIAVTGTVLARLLPEDSPGMILEMPAYRLPKARVVLAKTWLRLKDFIIVAWPLLIAGSALLSLADQLNWTPVVNGLTRPLTALLGLPKEVGMTLIFGVLRKELSLLMLFQALGTQDVAAVLTTTQMLTFTLFVVFYIPCLATLGVLVAEIGWKRTAAAVLITLLLAVSIALAGRGFGAFFL